MGNKNSKKMKRQKAKKNIEDKKKTLNDTIDNIKNKFGKSAIMRLGEVHQVDVEAVPTGSISLDIALGIGGIPRGRIIELYGPESSGKTTLALHIIANFQKKGGIAAFVDTEHALDPAYAKRIGVNTDDLLVSQPETGEKALDIVETLVRSNNIDIIIVDSVAALTPKAEIEGEMGETQVGAQARLMSHALRKLTGIVANTKTTVLFTNQTRMKIGVMFGNPETTSGGKALKFYSSVRIEVRRRATIKKGDKLIGNRTKAKVVKNKVATPFQLAEFDIIWPNGISKEGDVLDIAAEKKIVDKAGSWYNYNNEKIGQGREAAKKYLADNPKIYLELYKKIWDKVKEEREKADS